MGEKAARWWGEPGGGPRPDPPGWWPEPDSLHWVRSPDPAAEPAGHDDGSDGAT